MHNRTFETRTIALNNGAAAGSTPVTCTAVDTLGYSGVRIIALLGALVATQVTSLKAQDSNDNGSTDPYADIAGSNTGPAADGDSNKSLILEIHKPRKRWIKPIIERGTANATILSVVVELFDPWSAPVAQDTSTSAINVLNAPADGTA